MAEVQISSSRFINETVCLGRATLTFVGGICMHVEGEIGEVEAAKLYDQPELFTVGPPKPVTVSLPGADALSGRYETEKAAVPVSEDTPSTLTPGEDARDCGPDAMPTLAETPGRGDEEPDGYLTPEDLVPPDPVRAAPANDAVNLLTVGEIRAKLTALGVDYDPKLRKTALAGLLRQAINDAAKEIPDPPGQRIRTDPDLLRPEGEEDFGRKLPRVR